MTHLSIHLLGQLQILMDGEPVTGFESDKVRALLVYLAVEAGRTHRREALAGLLWPERPESSALNNLRGALSNLRKAIHDQAASPPFILATRQTIRFNLESDHRLDASGLVELAGQRDLARLSTEALEAAVSPYRGPFLEGFMPRDSAAFEEWAWLKREQINRQLSRAYQALVSQYDQAGAHDRALDYAWCWAELESIDEEAHRRLMRLLAAGGQRTAALAQYETLCRTLEEELDVEPSEETQALYQALLDEEVTVRPPSMPLPTPEAAPVALPVQVTTFVGRAAERAQIAGLLEDPACRLLALTGPGGVGKTRLALQAALEGASDFVDGVFFVPLAPLNDAEFLVSAIAASLNFTFYGPEDPKEQLLNHLRGKQMLLVLDNFEHLLSGAGLLAEIRGCAPQLKLMVTSRERLNLQGEWIVEVGGMDFPGDEPEKGLEEYDAIRLFLQSARRVRPDFSLRAANRPFITRICQLMQGMPLGIELSTTWLRTLSTKQIVTEIEHGLEFLHSSLRDVPERHRSLWAAFDHSWKLLSEDEQAAFRRLSVFRGGFDRDAAEQIAGASLPILSALVDKSLVRRGGSGRYEIHELLRQYAGSQLVSAGEEEASHRRHRDRCLSLAEQIAPDLWGAGDPAWLEMERDNYRAALQWSMDNGEAEELLRLVVVLTWFWYVRADFSEGRRWLGRALEMEEDASPAIRAVAVARAGIMATTQRDFRSGEPLAEKALLLLEETGNLREMGWVFYHLGLAALQQGDFEAAVGWYARSEELFRQIGYEEGVASMRMYLGVAASYQRDYRHAKAFLEESLPILREAGDAIAAARALHGLGLIAFYQGDFERAKNLFREGLAVAYGKGARSEVAQLLEILAAAVCQQGQHRRSCLILGFSDGLRSAINTPLSTVEQIDYQHCLSTVRANLADEEFADAWSEGQAMTLEQAVRYALEETG